MAHNLNILKAKDLLSGKVLSVSGDGFTLDVTASAAIVDNKPLYFLSTYQLDDNYQHNGMIESKSFLSLKALREAVSAC